MTREIGIAKPQYWAVSHEKEHSDPFFDTPGADRISDIIF
jgi:hypothetical protein